MKNTAGGQISKNEWTIGSFLIVALITMAVTGWSSQDLVNGLLNGPLWKPVATIAGMGIATYLLRRVAMFVASGSLLDFIADSHPQK